MISIYIWLFIGVLAIPMNLANDDLGNTAFFLLLDALTIAEIGGFLK